MIKQEGAIASYLAAEEAGSNIFARLNLIRCKYAIQNAQDSYVALRDSGEKVNRRIDWHRLQTFGFKRPALKLSQSHFWPLQTPEEDSSNIGFW
jgi:hypothetical protein